MLNLDPGTAAASKPEARQSADLSLEFDLLFAAARTAPDCARIEALSAGAVDWRALLELVASEGVRPLVYKSLHETCWSRVPADVQQTLEEAHRLITGRNLFLTGELLRVTAEFHKAGIPVAAIKGPVIAQIAYGDFTLREFSDLDLLVHEPDFPRAVELIAQLGYKPIWELGNRRVLQFLRYLGEYKLTSDFPGVDIDLHWKTAHQSVALSPRISDFPGGFQPIPIAGSTAPTFAPQDLPLYLCSQGGGDQWGDLRRICDLAEFLHRYPEVDWEPHFRTASRLGGLRSMLTGLALAHKLLGATLPASAASRIHADGVVARLVDRTTRNLLKGRDAGEGASRYRFQIRAKQGLYRKFILAFAILTDRTSEDGSWLMLPRPLWWAYGLLRPLRMGSKLLRRA